MSPMVGKISLQERLSGQGCDAYSEAKFATTLLVITLLSVGARRE